MQKDNPYASPNSPVNPQPAFRRRTSWRTYLVASVLILSVLFVYFLVPGIEAGFADQGRRPSQFLIAMFQTSHFLHRYQVLFILALMALLVLKIVLLSGRARAVPPHDPPKPD